MRHIMFLCLLGFAGCQNVIGPFEPRSPARVDDPKLNISEQESRGRNRYAIPDDSPHVAPPSAAIFAPGR